MDFIEVNSTTDVKTAGNTDLSLIPTYFLLAALAFLAVFMTVAISLR
jgi:hypothetical protein